MLLLAKECQLLKLNSFPLNQLKTNLEVFVSRRVRFESRDFTSVFTCRKEVRNDQVVKFCLLKRIKWL